MYRDFTVALLVFAMFPVSTYAQSLEWLAEHPGSTTVVMQTQIPNTNVGLEQRVRSYFFDIPIMAEIARCESRFRQFDDSGNPLDGGSGSMIGLFQIHAPVHNATALSLGMDILSVEGNLAYAKHLYQAQGTDPWLSSFSCWHNASQSNSAPQTLTQDLFLGSIHPEVKGLQVLLNAKGYLLAQSGPGSPGQETEKFGSLTRLALRRFQCETMSRCSGSEHENGYGMLDVSTREALLKTPGTVVAIDNGESQEIERLQRLIAELSAQLFALKQKYASHAL